MRLRRRIAPAAIALMLLSAVLPLLLYGWFSLRAMRDQIDEQVVPDDCFSVRAVFEHRWPGDIAIPPLEPAIRREEREGIEPGSRREIFVHMQMELLVNSQNGVSIKKFSLSLLGNGMQRDISLA